MYADTRDENVSFTSVICNQLFVMKPGRRSWHCHTTAEYENIQLDMDELTVARPLETNVRDDRSFTRH